MILITGGDGQLGTQFKKIYTTKQAIYTNSSMLDLTNKDLVEQFFKKKKISFIINCAAYTAVDLAETEQEKCFKVNADGVETLARMSSKYEIPMIHFSTDYVFDGTGVRPYVEDDVTNPMSVYGKSKLEGEKRFMEFAHAGAIIRTSWVYAETGKNFFLTMAKLMKEKTKLNIVCDQKGSPTYALDIAVGTKFVVDSNPNSKSIYHFSCEGETTWYDFADEIAYLLKHNVTIGAVTTKEYNAPAPRPLYSVLNKQKFKSKFNFVIRNWKEALRDCVTTYSSINKN